MFNRITVKTKTESKQKRLVKADLQPLGYALVGVLFGGILTLSALNDFLFFGWLSICSAIIFGLLTIHSIGEQQTRKYKNDQE